jgi:hypothetical protein
MRIACLVSIFALAACTPMQWSRQDASAAQAEKDSQECQDLAYKQMQAKPYPYLAVDPLIVQDSFARAQNRYPPGVFVDPYGDRFIEEGRIASQCMRSRGYDLTRK